MDIEEAKEELECIKNSYRDCEVCTNNCNKCKRNKAIETVLQELEELQQKEKSRIIGNIYEIKIEDLEPVLKPYYISKDKVRQMIINLRASCTNNSTNNIYNNQINNQIRILEELLEDK